MKTQGLSWREIGHSEAYWIAIRYEKLGKYLHAAKFHLLSGYGLSIEFIQEHHLSDRALGFAMRSAAKHIEDAIKDIENRGMINGRDNYLASPTEELTQVDVDIRNDGLRKIVENLRSN
jgi:hypothetical protein